MSSISQFIFIASIFTSSFLLFLVQPMVGKFILPYFGGSTSVWLVTLLFFQFSLLFGYGYSFIVSKLHWQKRVFIHIGLLFLSLFFLPIDPVKHILEFQTTNFSSPEYDLPIKVLLALSLGVFIPYFTLSTSTPFIQSLASLNSANSEKFYSYYIYSNIASLLALVFYPLIFENFVSLDQQSKIWSIFYSCFLIFISLSLFLIYSSIKKVQINPSFIVDKKENTETSKFSIPKVLFYGFCTSALLLSVTSHLTQNVSSIPLIWIAPLFIYLLSFIISFSNKKINYTNISAYAFLSILFMMFFIFYKLEGAVFRRGLLEFSFAIPIYITGFLMITVYTHRKLFDIKPSSENSSSFYFYFALGSALGSFIISILFPIILQANHDLFISLLLCSYILLSDFFKNIKIRFVFVSLFVLFYANEIHNADKNVIYQNRSFYSTIKINDFDLSNGAYLFDRNVMRFNPNHPYSSELPKISSKNNIASKYRTMVHGQILHGIQVIDEYYPTTYYTRNSGLAASFQVLRNRNSNLNVGFIGMGTGTSSIYGKTNDNIDYFEIDPLVVEVQKKYFNFNSPAHKPNINTYIVDGRVGVESQPDNKYDLLAFDAFSSDAIPVHLMTQQALQNYLKKIKDNGFILFHISNRYVNLESPLAKHCEDMSLYCTVFKTKRSNSLFVESTWFIISKNQENIEQIYLIDAEKTEEPRIIDNQKTWTDNYSSILPILIF